MESNIKHSFDPIKEFKVSWITDKFEKATIVYLENFGFFLCDRNLNDRFPGMNALTTAQLRNIFGEIRRIQGSLGEEGIKDEAEFINKQTLLLYPKLAYNAARQIEKRRESKIRQFREVLESALDGVKDKDTFERFVQFVEGIVAYHKVYGGKDSTNR